MAGRGQVRPDFFIIFLPVPMTTSFSVIRDTTPASAITRGAVGGAGQLRWGPSGAPGRDFRRRRYGAQAQSAPAYAVTFEPHPRTFFSPNTPQFKLTDLRNKLRLSGRDRPRRRGGHDIRRETRRDDGTGFH
jgi:riboflavin kinase/FMN adenylyltransferase